MDIDASTDAQEIHEAAMETSIDTDAASDEVKDRLQPLLQQMEHIAILVVVPAIQESFLLRCPFTFPVLQRLLKEELSLRPASSSLESYELFAPDVMYGSNLVIDDESYQKCIVKPALKNRDRHIKLYVSVKLSQDASQPGRSSLPAWSSWKDGLLRSDRPFTFAGQALSVVDSTGLAQLKEDVNICTEWIESHAMSELEPKDIPGGFPACWQEVLLAIAERPHLILKYEAQLDAQAQREFFLWEKWGVVKVIPSAIRCRRRGVICNLYLIHKSDRIFGYVATAQRLLHEVDELFGVCLQKSREVGCPEWRPGKLNLVLDVDLTLILPHSPRDYANLSHREQQNFVFLPRSQQYVRLREGAVRFLNRAAKFFVIRWCSTGLIGYLKEVHDVFLSNGVAPECVQGIYSMRPFHGGPEYDKRRHWVIPFLHPICPDRELMSKTVIIVDDNKEVWKADGMKIFCIRPQTVASQGNSLNELLAFLKFVYQDFFGPLLMSQLNAPPKEWKAALEIMKKQQIDLHTFYQEFTRRRQLS